MVEALNRSGLTDALARGLQAGVSASADGAAAASGLILAVASNLMNNLPAGLIASTAIVQAHAPPKVVDALLIGVDVGPNLSITGSLATILWLTAIRREGEEVGFARFLKVGALVHAARAGARGRGAAADPVICAAASPRARPSTLANREGS